MTASTGRRTSPRARPHEYACHAIASRSSRGAEASDDGEVDDAGPVRSRRSCCGCGAVHADTNSTTAVAARATVEGRRRRWGTRGSLKAGGPSKTPCGVAQARAPQRVSGRGSTQLLGNQHDSSARESRAVTAFELNGPHCGSPPTLSLQGNHCNVRLQPEWIAIQVRKRRCAERAL